MSVPTVCQLPGEIEKNIFKREKHVASLQVRIYFQ